LLAVVQRRKVVVNILLGWDRNSVAGCGTKLPVGESGEHFVIESRAQTLNDRLLHDRSMLVDRDFDDHIAFDAREISRIDGRIRGEDRQGRTNFVTVSFSVER